MATHRLETIVQAPEAALYFLARNPRAVSKTTPRAATAALSSALILAQRSSVSVLVEDQDDELFYRTVFESLVRLGVWESEHAIEFKSVAKTAVDIEDGGGATMVAKKIEAIHKIVDVFDNIAPYRLLFGLIDRDAENKKSPGMEVLQRYSMENYVFEPMVIYCHLLSSSAAPYVKGLDWLGPGDQAKVRELPCGQKQAITDAIVSQVESIWKSGPVANVVKLESDELEKVSVLYVEGLDVFTTLQLPKWLIDRRGHDLQKVLQEVFSAKVNAGALRKVFGELRVVPQELHEIFSSFVQQNTKESA
ncbi:hypothetical protein GCM10009107_11030 [Ideonella azotifigens]|uniref:Uncharacterized protein n=2 Tax=Ideonella azotifigens TaxID=513160 RepID=A0ABN1JR16_9BURK